MSKYLVFEVSDSFDLSKKFSSNQVMFCGDEECAYYTIELKLLVNHLFYDPRHGGLPQSVTANAKGLEAT
jgi:hypothetical protein